MAEFVKAHPAPREAAADIVLTGLKACENDSATVRAFARVHDKCEFLIDWMVQALEVKDGAKKYRDNVMVILNDATTAMPNMIEAAGLIAQWDPDHDFTGALQGLKRSLEFQSGYIENDLALMSPPGSHQHADALRYLVWKIDYHTMAWIPNRKSPDRKLKRLRAADLARLAAVALDNRIVEKMVRDLRWDSDSPPFDVVDESADP
jgi:hypothetical protein